jgi:S1-C subfamily serine protease
MDELLVRCYGILGIAGNASRQEAAEAFEALKRRYQGIDSATGERVGPQQWEKLKELSWAYDTLLPFLPEEEEQVREEKKPEVATPTTPTSANPDGESPGFVIRTDFGRARFIAKTISLLLLAFVFMGTGLLFWQAKLRHSPHAQRIEQYAPQEGNQADILQHAKKAVITVTFEERISGSAFLISTNGYIVTNAHVVKNKRGMAQFSSGETEEVELVLMDPEKDFALLKVSSKNDYPYLKLGDSNLSREGDSVIAIGSPFTLQSTFTKGIVSAKDRTLPGRAVSFIQTDAAVNPGNSGGPLINGQGEVVGINTWVVSKGLAEGLNFAIAINDVKSLIERGRSLSEEERRTETADVEAKWRRTLDQYHRDNQDQDASREQWLKEYFKRLEELRRRNAERVEQERKRVYEMVQQKREELSRCLRNSYDDYDSDWRAECRRIRSPSGCRLPEKEVVRMDRRYREDQEDCYKKYNQS